MFPSNYGYPLPDSLTESDKNQFEDLQRRFQLQQSDTFMDDEYEYSDESKSFTNFQESRSKTPNSTSDLLVRDSETKKMNSGREMINRLIEENKILRKQQTEYLQTIQQLQAELNYEKQLRRQHENDLQRYQQMLSYLSSNQMQNDQIYQQNPNSQNYSNYIQNSNQNMEIHSQNQIQNERYSPFIVQDSRNQNLNQQQTQVNVLDSENFNLLVSELNKLQGNSN
ncbi:hypothetical protein M0811_10770 [Anaeramoeba ignava]|uniref:Uncharacterized protein n=1 Tax=Anaeramoeba ignava TaxID=1746090 RepID=A0A9Q0LD42_ANAIG|nr:hypothetical protein M0811_10770 [Anaeramoeba ignava]